VNLFAPLRGAAYLGHGFKLINQEGLRRYAVAPLILNGILFGAGIWYGADKFASFIDGLLPTWLDWLQWLLWPLFAVTVLIAAFYTFTIIANFIASPFNSLLAAQVERRLGTTISQSEFSITESLLHEVKKFIFLVAWAVPLGVLFLIPGLNLVAPFAWLIFSAWLLALEYCDYPMANHGIPFREQQLRLRGQAMLNLGFGAATLVATSIPIVNLFVMPAAVAGATALWFENMRPNSPTTASDR